MKKYYFVPFMFFVPFFSFSQWNFNPAVNTPVSVQPFDQQDLRIATDGKEGAIITWLDFRNDSDMAVGDIYVQHIDKNGFANWTTNGVVLCNLTTNQAAPAMVEDGSGGAIIVWNDYRNGNSDIYAQKIDSSGNILWAANGLSIVIKAFHQKDAKMISDEAGGAIIVWQDSSSGSWDIYAQRISSSGTLAWTGSGVALCTATNSQINPRIETDEQGGAIITWQDKRNGADYDIYAQRVNSSGVAQWTANGISISSSIGTQSNPKIEPDGSGGVIITWQDYRNGLSDIYAQKVNASGITQWTTNGIIVCNAANTQSAVDMTSKGISGAIITWKDERNGNLDIYAQKVDLNGNTSWTANGVPVSTAAYSQLNPNIIGDGSGGVIITWQDSSAGNWDVYAVKINSSGVTQWSVPVGIAANNQTSPKNVSDGTGGSIFAWQDKRNETTSGFDIYSQRILSDGTQASVNEFQSSDVRIRIFPNPFSESATLQIMNLPAGQAGPLITNFEFHLYDVIGAEVKHEIIRNSSSFVIRRDNLLPGIYFYKITSNDYFSTGKFIISE